ncbi:unnamed protein product [Ceratitis capitata]|uniref:(Mediterranean fruit fly) hypothetical protein n=1 Tax=Ceratitis capitata TaxID=7213 RepID=A0A811UFF4_CERCA|nr:unnamed protein product [Ceratitis capitata]
MTCGSKQKKKCHIKKKKTDCDCFCLFCYLLFVFQWHAVNLSPLICTFMCTFITTLLWLLHAAHGCRMLIVITEMRILKKGFN